MAHLDCRRRGRPSERLRRRRSGLERRQRLRRLTGTVAWHGPEVPDYEAQPCALWPIGSFSRRETVVVNPNAIGLARTIQSKKKGVADGSYPFTVLQPRPRQFVSLSVAILSA